MSERSFSTAVAVRERASGRFLAAGAVWTEQQDQALVLEPREAAGIVRRFACEPDGIEVVGIEVVAGDCLAVA